MRTGRHTDRIDAIAFLTVVGTTGLATLSVLAYRRSPFAPLEAAIALALGAVFLVAGTIGFAHCRRRGSFALSLGYFALQIAVAATLAAWFRGGLIWLIMLPLAGQSAVLLPRAWMVGVCAILTACVVMPFGFGSGWAAAAVIGTVLLAGEVLVVAFSLIAVDERAAREKVERLATDLASANHELRQYALTVEELTREAERSRLSREIHDSLGHYLTVINIQLEVARTALTPDAAEAAEAVEKARGLVREALAEVRRSVASMHARPTDGRSLPEATAALACECRSAGVETELIVAGTPRPLDPRIEHTLYRTAQEALTNVCRHARATLATLLLDYRDEGAVRLTVRDDGVGCAGGGEGFGLLGIRERARLLGGTCSVRTADGEGFTLEVELPCR